MLFKFEVLKTYFIIFFIRDCRALHELHWIKLYSYTLTQIFNIDKSPSDKWLPFRDDTIV